VESNSELRRSAPLLDAYLTYFEADHTPFTIPGHKQRASQIDTGLGAVVDSDIPLYGGLDEIKLTNQVLAKAEKLAATLWGADFARFSTGGSTHANQAVILALGQPGDKVAISRTAHRSVLSALVLTELSRALQENPVAVLLTEPGYLGTLSDLKPLIAAAHEKSIPVIVDAAWGGHFGFHPDLPAHVISQGADALVTSVHKALPGYSASAQLLARTKFISAERLEQSFETTHTTSPAGAPLASIDAVRALLQTRGPELLGTLIENVAQFKLAVQANFDLPIFLNPSDFPAGRFDPVKVVLRVQQLGAAGVEIERALIAQGFRVEMADNDTIVFLATLADTKEDFQALAMTLVPILKKLQNTPRESATALSWSVVPQIATSMRDAYFAKTEMVNSSDAIGRISADLIAPYPPGVAVVAPGEVLTEQIVSGLSASQKAGVRIAYATDPTLKSYRVVKK